MGATSRIDQPRLRDVLAAQYDVITAAQAIKCGLTRKAVQHRLRADGTWQRLLPGVFLAVTGAVTQQHREMAALLYAGPRSILTGPVAVRHHALPSPGPNIADVLVPLSVRRSDTAFVRLHRTTRLPVKYCTAGQIRFAAAVRAVADAARGFSKFGDVRSVVCDALQHGKSTVQELMEEIDAGPRQGSALLRVALEEAGDSVRSVAEAQFRELILRSGLPRPIFNAQLFDVRGRHIATVDAWWGMAGVAAEVDSRQFHYRVQDQDDTADRHDELAAHGILALHFAPKVIRTAGERVVSQLARSIAEGIARPPLPIEAVPLMR